MGHHDASLNSLIGLGPANAIFDHARLYARKQALCGLKVLRRAPTGRPHTLLLSSSTSLMANLIHPTPQFGFRTDAVNHSPALGFGFGLSPAAAKPGWQPPHALQPSNHLSSLSNYNPHSSPSHPKVTQKRRHEDEDRDESMDRSPTPERRPMRRKISKRARVSESGSNEGGEEHQNKPVKDRKPAASDSGDGVDVGMLLGGFITLTN